MLRTRCRRLAYEAQPGRARVFCPATNAVLGTAHGHGLCHLGQRIPPWNRWSARGNEDGIFRLVLNPGTRIGRGQRGRQCALGLPKILHIDLTAGQG